MSQGLGIRYTSSGVRILGLERSEEGINVTGIAAGSPGEMIEEFIRDHGFSLDDSTVVFGLCSGDFLSAFIQREEGMDNKEIREQLRWEIERKMISESSEYKVNYAVTDTMGYVFAGRRKLIDELKVFRSNILIDVEPVALYNGYEEAHENSEDSVLILSVEAEGISSVFIQDGLLRALESFPLHEDVLSPDMAGPGEGSISIKHIDRSSTEQLSEYVIESVNRFTLYSENISKPSFNYIIIAGGGEYIDELTRIVEQKSGIPTIVSNPFASFPEDIKRQQPELAEMSAAYTTCFGLAVRAL